MLQHDSENSMKTVARMEGRKRAGAGTHSGFFCTAVGVCMTLAGSFLCQAGGVVTNCAEGDLRAALVGGGIVTFECDGILTLSAPLFITNDTTMDASGHDLILIEGPVVEMFRLLQVNPGVTLALNHLTLANGFARGTNSAVGNGTGGDGFGGAVWNNAGTFQANDCTFSNNLALGGTGGPGVSGTIAFNFGGGATVERFIMMRAR